MAKKEILKNAAAGIGNAAKKTGGAIANAPANVINAAGKSKQAVINALDQDGDGDVDIEDIIALGLKTPGIKINRSDFLRAELTKHYPEDVIEDAIRFNPAHANIPAEEIERLANHTIQFERTCVSGISAALSTPGGATMGITIPADIAQYYGYMLRAMQKLMYLYGFPEIEFDGESKTLDTETMNTMIICLGVMYGVNGANKALTAMANALGKGVEKKLLNAALTKGTLYPMVKSISKWFGVNMTKQIFAGFFKKAIPLVSGVIGGGITYLSFKPCCIKLQKTLRDTILSNPEKYASDTREASDILDVEWTAEEIENPEADTQDLQGQEEETENVEE